MPQKRISPQPKEPQRVESIGDRVAQARRMLGVTLKRDISRADLAQMAGLPASTVNRIEEDETKDPEDGTLKKLASVLGVTPSVLRYGDTSTQIEIIPTADPRQSRSDADAKE